MGKDSGVVLWQTQPLPAAEAKLRVSGMLIKLLWKHVRKGKRCCPATVREE